MWDPVCPSLVRAPCWRTVCSRMSSCSGCAISCLHSSSSSRTVSSSSDSRLNWTVRCGVSAAWVRCGAVRRCRAGAALSPRCGARGGGGAAERVPCASRGGSGWRAAAHPSIRAASAHVRWQRHHARVQHQLDSLLHTVPHDELQLLCVGEALAARGRGRARHARAGRTQHATASCLLTAGRPAAARGRHGVFRPPKTSCADRCTLHTYTL